MNLGLKIDEHALEGLGVFARAVLRGQQARRVGHEAALHWPQQRAHLVRGLAQLGHRRAHPAHRHLQTEEEGGGGGGTRRRRRRMEEEKKKKNGEEEEEEEWRRRRRRKEEEKSKTTKKKKKKKKTKETDKKENK